MALQAWKVSEVFEKWAPGIVSNSLWNYLSKAAFPSHLGPVRLKGQDEDDKTSSKEIQLVMVLEHILKCRQ